MEAYAQVGYVGFNRDIDIKYKKTYGLYLAAKPDIIWNMIEFE